MGERRLSCTGITEVGTDYYISMTVQEYTIDEQKEVWKSIAGYSLSVIKSEPPANILAQVKTEGQNAADQYDRELAAQETLKNALIGFTLP